MTTILHHLDRPEGRIAYTLTGTGPLVVTAPGMGDLREVYRDVVTGLVAAGYRVASTDLRGHGASDTTFTTHGVRETADDLLALVEHLGSPAVLVGHSMSAGSAAWVAAERPDLVVGLGMLSPHLQAGATSWLVRAQVALLIRRPWGAAAWAAFYRSLHRGRRAPWFDDHVAAVRTALHDPSRMASFRALSRTLVAGHPPLPLDQVTVPVLVAHGDRDPEVTDPVAELDRATTQLTAASVTALLVPESGHYPHSQRADVLVPALLELLTAVARRSAVWANAGA